MQHHQVEPVAGRLAGTEDGDFAVYKRPMESLVTDITQTKECEARVTFAQKQRTYYHIVEIRGSPKVVAEAGG